MVGLTEAVATWRDIPEIGIDPTEADELMKATQNVLRHYSIETTQKGADFLALFGVVGMIGGTRVGAYNMRKRIEREEQRSNFGTNVIRMPQAAPSQPSPAPQPPKPASMPAAPSPPVEPSFSDEQSGF